jgi:hypothetical protein
MSDRRRHARFSVNAGWEGRLRTLEEVVVETQTRDDIWVISRTPALPDERFTLHLTGSGPPALLAVRVAESRPVLIDGGIRNRVHLVVIERHEALEGALPGVLPEHRGQSS